MTPVKVTTNTSSATYAKPTWSPDGARFVFTKNGRMHTSNVGGTEATDISSNALASRARRSGLTGSRFPTPMEMGFPTVATTAPSAANTSQKDTDADGAGNACDADDDGDEIGDGRDACPLVAGKAVKQGCKPSSIFVSVSKTGGSLRARGRLVPAHPAIASRSRSRGAEAGGSSQSRLGDLFSIHGGRYVATFRRSQMATCKVTERFRGDADYAPSRPSSLLGC
jgi:Thrombospondin type 3 repeat